MDQVDRKIIAELRNNGRATYAELGRTVGLSASSVHERVGKLEAAGVITGYHAVVDPRTVGLGVTALVGIQPTDTASDDEVAVSLGELAEVESCYAVAGDEAFVVKVRVETVDELESTLGRLRRIHGVARTHTTVVLSTRFEGRPNNTGLELPEGAAKSG
ncbi:Lrp/AsnC family transcriptional regulator [Prauserella cavernicola]|uniref:Lrp/AsnC family transcriptional regulator n=1 Tax=Prauserella cavernicola TaxID=2800127 RepID=A0A934QP28_9PSEU|nr:Lrp/AsnC family transcriptional regulator [Prauserella cavernicola]MBK1784176.1 Lrp/AsnC family transcriptional regulator [Prauserella cavernicola]